MRRKGSKKLQAQGGCKGIFYSVLVLLICSCRFIEKHQSSFIVGCFYSVVLFMHNMGLTDMFALNLNRAAETKKKEMCTLQVSISQSQIFHRLGCFPHAVSLAVSALFARRAPTLRAVWHQGLLWTVSQHRHVTVECRCHQPSRGHGGAVHLQRPRRTSRPLHAKPGEIRPRRLHPALQPLVSRWVTVPFVMLPSALIIIAHSEAGL